MIVRTAALSFPSTVTLKMGRRVRFDGTELQYATAAQKADGTLSQNHNPKNESQASVHPWHQSGNRKMVANAAIPAYGYYSNAADGKIQPDVEASAKGRLMGRAATKDGDIVEVSPFSNAD